MRLGLFQLTAQYDDFSSILKKTERTINSDPEISQMITKVFGEKKVGTYKNLVDLLFCETFPEWKKRCMNYYKGRGTKLSENSRLSEESIKNYDTILNSFILKGLKENKNFLKELNLMGGLYV